MVDGHLRSFHPVWDYIDWGQPSLQLRSPRDDPDPESMLRLVNELITLGNFLFVACEDGSIDVYDISTKIPTHVQCLLRHEEPVLCLTGDEDCLFSGSADKSIAVWLINDKVAEKEEVPLWSCSHMLLGHTGIATVAFFTIILST
jgi:WD40 repeat protein